MGPFAHELNILEGDLASKYVHRLLIYCIKPHRVNSQLDLIILIDANAKEN